MSQTFESRRARLITITTALALAVVLLGFVAVGIATADSHTPGDEIVLETVDGVTQFTYGDTTQVVVVSRNECDVSSTGDVMALHAVAYDKKGDPVDPASVGLVEDGLGVSESGRGNGQECGRVDNLGGEFSEALTLTLGSVVQGDGKMIESIDFDFEAKFDAVVSVEYFSPSGNFTETYETELTGNGSDSGPDAKSGDKYRVLNAPKVVANQGKLISGIRISMESGSVSLEGGASWPDPSENRTVFHLIDALGCGDSDTAGGPLLQDDPRAAFYLGPNKDGSDCAVPVSIQTDNLGTGQTVYIGPPSGYAWDGVTGVVTIEWDVETPDDQGVGRTLQVLDSGSEVIPWCNDVVQIAQASGQWFYELLDPDATYPTATGGGDVCLIFQNTTTVDDGTIFTQTTETFYIWDDPRFVRN